MVAQKRISLHSAFLLCAFTKSDSNCSHNYNGCTEHGNIGCNYLTFVHGLFSCVSSNCLLKIRHIHNGSIFWCFATVCFQMRSQIAFIREGTLALDTFICFFSIVCFQMSPQIICVREGIFTLVAFILLFSMVSFQKSL